MTATGPLGVPARDTRPGVIRDRQGDDLLTPPVATADAHLLDTDFGGRLSATQEKHLMWCGWCQVRSGQAMLGYDQVEEEEFLAAARKRAMSEDGAALKKLTTLRPNLHTLVVGEESGSDVEIGQLWRLRWRDRAETALVLAVDRCLVTVAPVTTDVAAADEYSVILPMTATLLGVPATVCFSLECVIPLFTFDRLLARPQPPAPAESAPSGQMLTAETVRAVWRAWRRGVEPPQQLTYGQPVVDGDLERRELRTALATELMPFVEASAAIPGETPGESPAPLRDLLRQAPRKNRILHYGLKPEVFLRVENGGRVTPQEAHLLACILNTDVETILAANPPLDEELVIEVSRPRWRSELRHLADQRHTTEDRERQRLADSLAAQANQSASDQPSPGQGGAISVGEASSPWAQVVAAQLGAELAGLTDTHRTE